MERPTHIQLVASLAKPGTDVLDSLTPMKCDLLHATVGIETEAGELLDAIKKHVIYNKDLDRQNVTEELGDLEFYMEFLRQKTGISREETLEKNIDKLMVRYAKGYSDKAAQDRADKSIGTDSTLAEDPRHCVHGVSISKLCGQCQAMAIEMEKNVRRTN